MSQRRKINSFTQKPSFTQILSYLLVLGDITVFYACMTPNFTNMINNIILSSLFGVLTIIVIISTAIASTVDPSDPVVEDHREARASRASFINRDYLYCSHCDAYCHQSSKHCRSCQRCVTNFDHHCIWINNCIGSANYRSFMSMIVSVMLQMATFIAAGVTLSLERQFHLYMPQMIVAWAYMGIVGILLFLIMNLVILHIYLICRGMTTYQLITLIREEERQAKIEELNKKKQQEKRKMQEARQQSDGVRMSIELGSVPRHHQPIEPQKKQSVNTSQKGEKQTNIERQHQEISIQKLKVVPKNRVSLQRQQQQFQSVGQVSIVPQEPEQPQESIRMSKFFKKNKSLHFIINSSQVVDQPIKPSLMRISDIH